MRPREQEPDDQRPDLPPGLTGPDRLYPVVHVVPEAASLHEVPSRRVNHALLAALEGAGIGRFSGQGLIKVHVGEPRCGTRMRPAYVRSSARFLKSRGASSVVAGDTTVAYTGPRGHRQNPSGDVLPYLALAAEHGWSLEGEAGVPFVVLDRPCSALAGEYEFDSAEERLCVAGLRRFSDVFAAGGFRAAAAVVNHAHLTLHGLAGVAGCVKSLAMGCSALPGKLRMHQALLPEFDAARCRQCRRCVQDCPEEALRLPPGAVLPTVEADLCIGCGECAAVCPHEAVGLSPHGISDWQRGEATLAERMTDYTVGLLQGRWDHVVHVLGMYDVTPRCDCVDEPQEALPTGDLGFLVSRNPFAVDLAAGRLLRAALAPEATEAVHPLLERGEAAAAYAREAYGLLTEGPIETIRC